MANINDAPTAVTSAGQAFGYTTPPEPRLASIVLVNAPLDPDHSNIGANQTAYDAFIAAEIAAGRAYVETDLNIQSPDADLELPIEYETALTFYNYGRLTIGGRAWYVFYTPEYKNKTVTIFRADIDEIPSFEWSLGYSMIERGHIAVAASQNDTYGNRYLTAPEPIEAPPVQGILGAEILGASGWVVIVTSVNDLRGNGSATPFFVQHAFQTDIGTAALFASQATATKAGAIQSYIAGADYPWHVGDSTTSTGFGLYVPEVTPSPLSTIDGVAAGGGAYLFTPAGWAEYETIMQGAPWIVAGITAIRYAPSWAMPAGGGATFSAGVPSKSPTDGSWAAAAGIPIYYPAIVSATTAITAIAGWRASALAAAGVPWLKLLTSQFCRIAVGNGESLQEYLPDQWQAADIALAAVSDAAHGGSVVRITPVGYNQLGDQISVAIPFSITSGTAKSGYGSAAANPGSADVSTSINATTANLNHEVIAAQNALALSLAYTNRQITLGVQGAQTVLGAASGAAGGPAGVLAAGGGALGGFITSAISGQAQLDLLDVAQEGSYDIAAMQLGLSGYQTQTSFDTWAQSLLASPGSGTAHSIMAGWRTIIQMAFKAIVTMPSFERIKALASMWNRYGYMIGQAFTPPTLSAMTHYTYWKTSDAVVIGAVPQLRRQTIAAAFDRGLTVWESISEIGTEPTNAPIAGITY